MHGAQSVTKPWLWVLLLFFVFGAAPRPAEKFGPHPDRGLIPGRSRVSSPDQANVTTARTGEQSMRRIFHYTAGNLNRAHKS